MERERIHLAKLHGAKQASFPKSIAPMHATLTRSPFNSPQWIFEPKLDGVRTIALVRDGQVKLLSRRGLNSTRQYPEAAEALASYKGADLVLDGEIVAFDSSGRPSFQLLQQRMGLTNIDDIREAEAKIPTIYYVFDILFMEGYDLVGASLRDRKALLAEVVVPSIHLQPLDYFASDGVAAFQAALEHGIEGIVAKHLDSRYEPGRRSRYWLKVKSTLSDDFVIGGFTEGSGHRAATFGSLLVGYYDQQSRLIYSGHVGSGFDGSSVQSIRRALDGLRSSDCPFATPPPQRPPAFWVKPELVAEIKFAELTHDGYLRAPVFQRLRPDKAPTEVQGPEPVNQAQTSAPPGTQQGVQADDVAAVLDQLKAPVKKTIINVGGHELAVNNLDKPLWPATDRRGAVTKCDYLIYLCKLSRHILHHLRDRPLTLVRYPHGVGGPKFYQKHWPDQLPGFVETVRLYSEQVGADQDYVVCQNLPTLLWLAQLADLELHCSLARITPDGDARHIPSTFSGSKQNIESSLLNFPDFVAFDLDPFVYTGREEAGSHPVLGKEGYAKCCNVANGLREVLETLHLPSFVKTSGATGLHVYVPIVRRIDYQGVRSIAEIIAQHLLSEHPEDVTIEWTVAKRTGKIFVDYNQNTRGKSLAVAYSPRALVDATVSMPLTWDEIESVFPTDFTIMTAPDRVAESGDAWAKILAAKVDVSSLFDR